MRANGEGSCKQYLGAWVVCSSPRCGSGEEKKPALGNSEVNVDQKDRRERKCLMMFLRIDLFVASTRLNLPSPSSPFSILIMTIPRCNVKRRGPKESSEQSLYIRQDRQTRSCVIRQYAPLAYGAQEERLWGWYHFSLSQHRNKKKQAERIKCKNAKRAKSRRKMYPAGPGTSTSE